MNDARCCELAGCFGLCYLTDVCCAIPTMAANEEEGFDRYSLPLFAFYECCWPCMRGLELCCGWSAEDRRALRRSVWPPDTINPHLQNA